MILNDFLLFLGIQLLHLTSEHHINDFNDLHENLLHLGGAQVEQSTIILHPI